MVDALATLERTRLRRGLGYKALAQKAQMSEAGVRSLLTGQVGRPHIASVRKLADALSVPMEQLVPEPAA